MRHTALLKSLKGCQRSFGMLFVEFAGWLVSSSTNVRVCLQMLPRHVVSLPDKPSYIFSWLQCNRNCRCWQTRKSYYRFAIFRIGNEVDRGTFTPVRETSPVLWNTFTSVRGTSPGVCGAFTPLRGTSSGVCGAFTSVRGTSPWLHGTFTPVRGTSPWLRGAFTPVRGTSPWLRDTLTPVRAPFQVVCSA